MLKEYNLPNELSFEMEIPNEVQKIIDSSVLMNEKEDHSLTKASENQSIIEDEHNHFHVDWFVSPTDTKSAFMLGIKTLFLLANKFQEQKIAGIRFWYHFLTPELSKESDRAQGHYTEGDEYYISDRLSFYKRREGEEVITINEAEDSYNSLLIIDI